MIPSIPAMLDTLRVPSSFPSLSLISPVGRSITKVGAFGVDGDENAYWEGEECTLISRKGRVAAAMAGLGRRCEKVGNESFNNHSWIDR